MSQTAPDDYCRLCKCCFKHQFGNFTKIVHISSQNLFKPSQRKQSFRIVLSHLCDKVGLPFKNSQYHSTKICNTCSRKILKVHELVMELKSSVTCNTLHENFQHHYQPKDVHARGASPFNRKSIHRVLVSLELNRNLRVKKCLFSSDYLSGQSSRNSPGTADNVDVMHESIPGVTIPPRDTPGNLPDRQFTGVGNLPFIYVHGGRVLEDPGDLTNGCPQSHPQILRQQNLVSGTHVGALIVFCALVVKVA